MHNITPKPGYTLDPALTQLWQVQLDLLQKFIDVCRRHDLRCWVEGGTMLGAVRHHGFIPWDDDVDVCMMRPDYDRLLQLAPQEFQSPFFYQTAYTDHDYYRSHAQLRMDGTTAIRPSDCYQPFHQGIFIDVFPMDGIPLDDPRVDDALRRSRRILRFLKAKNTRLLASGRVGLVARKWRARREVARRGWHAIFSEAEELFRQFPAADCPTVGILACYGKSLVHQRQVFDHTILMPFEDIEVPVPAGYDEYLRTVYGSDYMTPRHDATLHGHLVVDAHRDYRDVLPEVQQQYSHSMLSRLLRKI